MTATFYLGVPEPSWLNREGEEWEGNEDIPLFVSYSRLRRLKKKLPKARGPWALDSSGFMHLRNQKGRPARWTISPEEYVDDVRRYREEIGGLCWCAPQDYMCERVIRDATGMTTEQHQRLTIENLLTLRSLGPELDIVPVLQGWLPGEYRRHVRMYQAAGIDLREEPLVAIGSVCRRQRSIPVSILLRELYEMGLKVHAFGYSIEGLKFSGEHLASSDSQAWSTNARSNPSGFGCTHKSCNYCSKWALAWYSEVISRGLAKSSLDLVA